MVQQVQFNKYNKFINFLTNKNHMNIWLLCVSQMLMAMGSDLSVVDIPSDTPLETVIVPFPGGINCKQLLG